MSAAGDVNGDGFDDVLVGSYGPLTGTNAPGRGYLVFGFDSGAVTQRGDANANTLTATAGLDVIVAGGGNDTVLNGGTGDVLRGGSGDDVFSLTSPPLKRLVGGHGFDTLTLNGGLLLDLTARPVYRINGFEQVDLRNGVNYLSLDARAVRNFSPDTNTLIVRADAADLVNIGFGWTATGTEIIDGDTFTVLTQGAAILKVSTAIAPIVTLVNATTATYRDVDGDLVTIQVSRGVLGISDFALRPEGTVGGAQLVAVNFADDGAEFQDANLTITAARSAAGGDGRVNVGRIEASGVDLGTVVIEGDLSQISAGDANHATPGIDTLRTGSMGRLGTSTQLAPGIVASSIAGPLGRLIVQSDLFNPMIHVDVAASVVGFGAVNVGGSILADTVGIFDFYTPGSAGAFTIGGDVRATAGVLAINILGNFGSLTVGGSMAASGTGFVAPSAGGTFGPVRIGGDLDHA